MARAARAGLSDFLGDAPNTGAPALPKLSDRTPEPGLLEAAVTRRTQQGALPPLSWQEVCEDVETCNREAMTAVREGRQPEAREQLLRAQSLLDRVEEPHEPEASRRLAAAGADTAANMGVHYGKCGDSALAIRHLWRALKLHGLAGAGLRTLAAAHLNLTASHLEATTDPAIPHSDPLRHAALQHAQAAVDLCGRLLASPEEPADTEEEDPGRSPRTDDCAMLAVAYHKVAEAYEGLRAWGKATHAYAQAYEVVRRGLGPHHQLTRSFERSSRCPGHGAGAAAGRAADRVAGRVSGRTFRTQAAASTPRSASAALPCMPLTRPQTSPVEEMRGYKITSEVFAPWPPRNSAKEEQLWYAMARQHRGQLKGGSRPGARATPAAASPVLAGKGSSTEPALNSFRASPSPYGSRA